MFTGHSEVADVPAPWILNSPIPGTARVHDVPRTPPPTCTEERTLTVKREATCTNSKMGAGVVYARLGKHRVLAPDIQGRALGMWPTFGVG